MELESELIYRHCGEGRSEKGWVVFAVACYATRCSGVDVGIVHCQVRVRETDQVLQNEWTLVECRKIGYFADAVERAVALYHDLERKYKEGAS